MFFRQLDCDIQLSLSIPQYAEELFQLNEGIIRRAEKVYDQYLDHVVYGWLKSDNRQSA
jgi:hypothetical protein